VFDKEDNDHLNMFKCFHSYHVGIRDDEFPTNVGLDKPNQEGNDKIIQHCLPLVTVYKPKSKEQSYSQQYSWFLSVHMTLYHDTVIVQSVECKLCLISFWL